MSKKIIVLMSGGLDSAVCAAKAIEEAGANNVTAMNAYYGQKHKKEIICARELAGHYGIDYLEINLSEIFRQSDSSLLEASGNEIKQRSYEESTAQEKLIDTYVPFRNGLLISAAAAVGLSIGADEIWYGAHADDMAGAAYPDCSVPFVKAMDRALREGTKDSIRVRAPFVKMTKAGVVKEGWRLRVPFKKTWSCYEGGEKPCGKCGTCIDRARAFKENNLIDPLESEETT